jgi:hypothetical protein
MNDILFLSHHEFNIITIAVMPIRVSLSLFYEVEKKFLTLIQTSNLIYILSVNFL